jgi:adenylate kinase
MLTSQTYIILGRSGSGKGTQAHLLEEKISPCLYVKTGELFRALAQRDTFIGRKVNKILLSGVLPQQWLAEFLWQGELISRIITGQENIIFDGMPRRLDEAKELDEMLEWLERKNLNVILLDISREEAKARLLKRLRSDDVSSAIDKRLDWFEAEVMPVVEYYKASGRLIIVDGIGSIEEIFERIIKVLNL